ncbi:hypothetical protein [Actinomycetospora aeridis]|uniref:Uncharacterized protein n=1 Tax=Actinomycetospora aeridis TaxID=3129231 RepID=A0ABU8N5Q6_9PSEU
MNIPTWATTLVQGPGASDDVPRAADVVGNARRLAYRDQVLLRTAGLHARRACPGAVGELVHRELLAHAEFGRELAEDSLPTRLVAQVLALPVRPGGGPGGREWSNPLAPRHQARR